MIAAILRAQFLSMRWGGGRRGAVFTVITSLVWYGLWTGAAATALVVISFTRPDQLPFSVAAGFFGIMAYWQLVPVAAASMGSGLDMRKLLVYPVPHGKLFQVDILLRLVTGAEMVLVLTGGTLGLLINRYAGGVAAAPRILTAWAVFILLNLSLASGMRSLLERLLARRRVREVLTFLMLMLYAVPRVLSMQSVDASWWRGFERALLAPAAPWGAAAHAALNRQPPVELLVLAAWTLAALWFGLRQFERSLQFDAVAAQATPLSTTRSRRQSFAEALYRLPGLLFRDPLAGLVEKELRALARTPRFRMVFLMGFTFGLMIWFPMAAGRRAGLPSEGSSYFLPVVCVYALTLLGQVTYWNCFGFDRSAAILYFAMPQPFSRVLIGKNVASLFFVYLEVAIIIAVTWSLRLISGWTPVVETLMVVGVCALYMLGLGNISSVRYPRGLSAERVAHGGAGGRGFQGFLLLLYPLVLLPVFLAYLARYALDSQVAFVIVLTLAAAIGGAFYWIAMESAVKAAGRLREQIVQQLSQSDGPVTSE